MYCDLWRGPRRLISASIKAIANDRHSPARQACHEVLAERSMCARLAWIHGLFIRGLATSRDHGESSGGEDRGGGCLVDRLSFRRSKGDGPV